MKLGFEVGADINDALNKFKELKKELVKVKDELKSVATDVKIKVALDSAPVISQARQIRTNLQNAIGEVKVKLTVDSASVAADAARIRGQVQTAIGETNVKVKLDSAGLVPQLAHIKNQINAYFAANASAIRISLSLAQADIAAIRARLASLTGAGNKIKLGIDLAYLNSQIAIARSMLASLTTGGVRINIDASATNLIASLNALRLEIDRLRLALRSNPPGPGPGPGGGGPGAGGLGGSMKQIAASAAAMVALTAAVAGLYQTVQSQREFDILNAQLVTATKSTENAKIAFEALQDFAKKTPYSLNQAVEGFTKLVNLGLTPSERALTSYGNTAAAMGKDLMQFIEAVADASTSEFERLKEFGIKAKQEGDKVSLTFQGVTKTIGNNAQEIEQYLMAIGENEFAGAMERRVDTLDGAIAALGDSWDALFLSISEAGVGDAIKDAVQEADDSINGLIKLLKSGAIQSALGGITRAFSIFSDDVEGDIDSIGSSFSWLGDFMSSVWKRTMNGINTYANIFNEVRAMIQKATVSVAAFVDIVSDPFNKRTTNQQKQDNYESSLASIDAQTAARTDSVKRGFEQAELLLYYQKLTDQENKNNKPTGDRLERFGLNNGKNTVKPAGNSKADADKARDAAEREAEALAKAKFERSKLQYEYDMAVLDRLYETSKIDLEAYYKQKDELLTKSANSEIAELQRRKQTVKKDSEKKELDNQIFQAQVNVNNEYNKLDDFRKSQLEQRKKDENQLNIDLARAEGKTYKARMTEIENQYGTLISKLRQQAAQEGISVSVKLELEKKANVLEQIKKAEEGRAKADDIGTNTNRIINNQRDKENVLNRAKDQNPWSTLTLDRAVNDTRQGAVKDLLVERDQLKDLQAAGHDVNEQMQQLNMSILELQQNVPTTFQEFSLGMRQAVGSALASGLTDLFTDLADGSKSASDAIEDFGKSFAKSIAQIIVQAMAAYAALLILNSIPGGAAVAQALEIAGAAGSAVKADKKHTGGIAGAGGESKSLDPALYLGAPKYHIGGIAGLAPGEIPAVLMQGEEVLTRDDPRHVANGGGQNGMSVKVVNVTNPEVTHDHMSTSAGEKVIINAIGRNASTINRLLGSK